MINTCFQHLETILKNLGFTQILDKEEDFDNFKGSKFASIALNEGRLTRDGVRVGVQDNLETMKRTYRYRLYRLALPIVILLADKNRDLVNAHMVNFISSLGTDIKDADSNPIDITVGNPQWLEDKSKLNPRKAVELPIVFSGGIYKDVEVTLIDLETSLEIQTESEV